MLEIEDYIVVHSWGFCDLGHLDAAGMEVIQKLAIYISFPQLLKGVGFYVECRLDPVEDLTAADKVPFVHYSYRTHNGYRYSLLY